MVDRGGLNYPIRVRDEFSKTTALFRKELRASKKEFRDFQKVAKGNKSAAADIRAQAKATKELSTAQRQLAKNTKASIKPTTDREKAARAQHATNKRLSRSIAEVARQQRQRERTAVALRNAASADARREATRVKSLERQAAAERKLAQSKSVEFQATRKLNQELFREAVARKQIEQLKSRARQQFGAGDFSGGTETLRRARAMEKSLKAQVGSAQKLLFTFRRLVGALAIFTLARRGVQVFNDLVRSGIKFNDVVANAQLGIAGLVVTLGDVRDEFGNSVGSAEQLGVALGIAREQTAKLRQDSLRTVATFEQLLDTFQVSVGPGLAAGLDLDEVRQLTVDISQAAAALGVPQNQLAEEVRSLLSGTIQARTTRIATALGISNEDVRRLKETGELFDFLEEKFSGFAEAAEKQARTTFTGITTLIKGLVQEILGEAAAPLFQELIALGNDLFDNFLSIRDAAGNIKPSPDVVAAFQQVFDSIKRTVEAFQELGTGSAIDSLDSVLAGIAITIDFVTGAVVQIISLFASLSGTLKDVAEFLGISSDEAGATASFFGKWLINALLIQKSLSFMSRRVLKIAGRAGIVVAAFVAIAKGVEFVLEKIFGIDLGIRDTIQLITLGLFGAWISVGEVVQVLGVKITNSLQNALDTVISAARSKALGARSFIASLFGDDEEAQRLVTEQLNEQLKNANTITNRRKRAEVEIADIRAQAAAKQKALEEEIADVIGERTTENNKGPGFRSGFDPDKAAADAAKAARTFVSTANRSVSDLGESLAKVNEELVKAEQLFDQASRSSGAGGVAGSVESAFNKEEIAGAERLRKIKADLVNVEREIARFRELGPEAEGALNSALQDQQKLKVAILNAEEQSLELAGLKAATLAAEALPALREESTLLAAQVAAERAKTAAITAGAGDRQLALVAAQAALGVAEAELAAAVRKNQIEQEALQAQAAKLPPGEELEALNAVIAALAVRQGFEEEILRLRTMQLEKAKEEADLVANGSLTEGLKEGFTQFAEQFGSTFNAGLEIARQGTQALANFASQAIVDAFDPTKEVDLKERFARLMQSIAQTILQQLISLAIAKAILGFKDGGVVPELSAGGVALNFNKGGKVPDHSSKYAQGLARGGSPMRPKHIPASDTVPAWLTPGEFVMNKAATSQFLPLLQGMNGGNMAVVGSSSAEAAGPSTGMQTGGLVSDRIANANSAAEGSEDGGGVVVVPAVVASDKEMDTLTAGGRNAMLAFMRENAGNINSLLDRSNGRR